MTLRAIVGEILRRIYLSTVGGCGRLNRAVLRLALNGQGFDNCCSYERSGEVKFIDFVARLNPKLCLDIGANRGTYSELLLTKTDSFVVAFEPLKGARIALDMLVDRFPGRLEIVPKAVSEHSGETRIYYANADSQHATISEEVLAIDFLTLSDLHSELIQTSSLDDFFRSGCAPTGEVDLLKIDTEGSELDVLRGASLMIAERPPKVIQIEFNVHHLFRGHLLSDFSALLPGFRLYQLLPFSRGLSKRDPHDPFANIFLYSNFAFVREDVVEAMNLKNGHFSFLGRLRA